ncbi:MAG: Gfo/Idh/MocA family oxidoreductase [Anaerolineae bacterium]|nr:Gfo/Idh/MocA family oxidoreductase [Anaerolineae bacterium]
MNTKLRFAMLGTGFWSYYQLSGWLETGEVECAALYDQSIAAALHRAGQFAIPPASVYDDLEAMLAQERFDFVDICTSPESHETLVRRVAEHGLPVVCQKPMATSLVASQSLVQHCKTAAVPFYVNENFRWQRPIRAIKKSLDRGHIGRVFRARLDYRSSFPVFDNQPYLKDLEQFILSDVGPHLFDLARFLFGEAASVYCQTQTVIPGVAGEDTATVILRMESGATVICVMSFATRREYDRFPETYVEIEGDSGFLELGPDYWLRETTSEGTMSTRFAPPHYAWAEPAYDVVHASIVPAQTNIARALKALEAGETTGEDNLKTMELVFRSYESAAKGQVIQITG